MSIIAVVFFTGKSVYYKIPSIGFSVGSSIRVLIIASCGQNQFIAQPYTPQLIQLMKTMRYVYKFELHVHVHTIPWTVSPSV